MINLLVNNWSRPNLLVIDKVECRIFSLDQRTANIFFQVVSKPKRYKNGDIILTSNKSFIEWR
ncbi:ATP-binding protein [Peribacillus frigoritolerans]|nr:ATP-binding protein [Peribacillus frigoritolerans]